MQQLFGQFLFWVCKFNFFPVFEKIGSKENHIADYLSRVYEPNLLKTYLTSNGYDNCSCIDIPSDFFQFKADW